MVYPITFNHINFYLLNHKLIYILNEIYVIVPNLIDIVFFHNQNKRTQKVEIFFTFLIISYSISISFAYIEIYFPTSF